MRSVLKEKCEIETLRRTREVTTRPITIVAELEVSKKMISIPCIIA